MVVVVEPVLIVVPVEPLRVAVVPAEIQVSTDPQAHLIQVVVVAVPARLKVVYLLAVMAALV